MFKKKREGGEGGRGWTAFCELAQGTTSASTSELSPFAENFFLLL